MSELEKVEQDLNQLGKDLMPQGKYWGTSISVVVPIVCQLVLKIARMQIEQMKRMELLLSGNFIHEYRHGPLGAEMRAEMRHDRIMTKKDSDDGTD